MYIKVIYEIEVVLEISVFLFYYYRFFNVIYY